MTATFEALVTAGDVESLAVARDLAEENGWAMPMQWGLPPMFLNLVFRRSHVDGGCWRKSPVTRSSDKRFGSWTASSSGMKCGSAAVSQWSGTGDMFSTGWTGST